MTTTSPGRRPFAVHLGAAVALASITVLLWYAWLGRDTRHTVDPVTGAASGPYEPWQVVGCVLSLITALAAAVWAGAHPVLAGAAVTVAFTVAWTVQAAAADESGLFAVGAVLILVAMTAGSAVVATAAAMARTRVRRYRGAP